MKDFTKRMMLMMAMVFACRVSAMAQEVSLKGAIFWKDMSNKIYLSGIQIPESEQGTDKTLTIPSTVGGVMEKLPTTKYYLSYNEEDEYIDFPYEGTENDSKGYYFAFVQSDNGQWSRCTESDCWISSNTDKKISVIGAPESTDELFSSIEVSLTQHLFAVNNYHDYENTSNSTITLGKVVIPGSVSKVMPGALFVGCKTSTCEADEAAFKFPYLNLNTLRVKADAEAGGGIETVVFDNAGAGELEFNYARPEHYKPNYYEDSSDFMNYLMVGLAEGVENSVFKIEINRPVTDYSVFNGIINENKGHIALNDNAEYNNETAATDTRMSYTRDFRNTWNGVCVPFNINVTELRGTAAMLTNYENNELVWTKQTTGTIAAGTPFIYKPNASGVDIISGTGIVAKTTITDVVVGTAGNQVTLSGTYEEKTDMNATLDGGKCYWALSSGNFYYTNSSEKTLNPYRIFLEAPKPTTAGAPIRNIIIDEDNEANYIGEIEGLEIVTSGKAYNLQGMEVGSDYKGIVIQNGKKVIRK